MSSTTEQSNQQVATSYAGHVSKFAQAFGQLLTHNIEAATWYVTKRPELTDAQDEWWSEDLKDTCALAEQAYERCQKLLDTWPTDLPDAVTLKEAMAKQLEANPPADYNA
jgi:hypothetical protein